MRASVCKEGVSVKNMNASILIGFRLFRFCFQWCVFLLFFPFFTTLSLYILYYILLLAWMEGICFYCFPSTANDVWCNNFVDDRILILRISRVLAFITMKLWFPFGKSNSKPLDHIFFWREDKKKYLTFGRIEDKSCLPFLIPRGGTATLELLAPSAIRNKIKMRKHTCFSVASTFSCVQQHFNCSYHKRRLINCLHLSTHICRTIPNKITYSHTSYTL